MKRIRLWSVVLLVACLPTGTLAAQARQSSPNSSQIRAAAFEIMKAARYCTLITLGQDGHPQARIVDPLVSPEEGSVWIATNPLTRKVKEIARDPRVTLMCFNAPGNEYVAALGRASVVTDAAQKARHWKPEWAPFYKQQALGGDFLLFEVRPFRLEVDSAGRGMVNDARTWRPVILDLKR